MFILKDKHHEAREDDTIVIPAPERRAVGSPWVQDQPGLHKETLSKKPTTANHILQRGNCHPKVFEMCQEDEVCSWYLLRERTLKSADSDKIQDLYIFTVFFFIFTVLFCYDRDSCRQRLAPKLTVQLKIALGMPDWSSCLWPPKYWDYQWMSTHWDFFFFSFSHSEPTTIL